MKKNEFEKIAHKPNGNIYIVSPGIVNSKSGIDLKLFNRKPKIILLSYKESDSIETFLNISKELKRQGYQVLIEYDKNIFEKILENNIEYIGIFPTLKIVPDIRDLLEQEIYENEYVFAHYYIDIDDVIKVNNIIKENTNKYLELMSYQYNIKQAIDEYIFLKRDKCQYI